MSQLITRRRRLRFVGRILVIWFIETLALGIMAALQRGVTITSFWSAAATVALMGLANALIWPTLIHIALPIAVLTLGLLVLLLNGLFLFVASEFVPGITIDSIWAAIIAAIGVSGINAVVSAWLGIDEDFSYYRNVTLRRASREKHPVTTDVPGILFLEIDGLSVPVLKKALQEGYMPTLQSWLEDGSHHLLGWEPDWSSQTGASQAGILHGDNSNIPAFRWYNREKKEIETVNRPPTAAAVEQARSDGDGLLSDNGVSRSNLFSGDAGRVLLTSSAATGIETVRDEATYTYFSNPYNFTRSFSLLLWDIAVEKKHAWSQWLHKTEPRVHRGGAYPLVRGAGTVLLRDINVYTLIGDMYEGVPSAYATFYAYDEVAHHSGIARPDALDILHKLDQQFARIEHAAELAPRPYHFVVLSDHGQSQGATFLQRYGQSLEELVGGLVEGSQSVGGSSDSVEGWDHLNVLLNDAVRDDSNASARAIRRVVGRRTVDGQVAFGPEHRQLKNEAKKDGEELPGVIVLASGNLGLVYFTEWERRANLGELNEAFPGLIPALATHEGIGFLMVRSAAHGPLAIGADGIYYLEEDRFEGQNPLADFGPNAPHHLRRSDTFAHVADIMINGFVDPESGEGAAFEELVGFHGGLGGPQAQPFILCPAELPVPDEPIIGAAAVYRLLKGWVQSLAAREAKAAAERSGKSAAVT